MSTSQEATSSRAWPLAIAVFAFLGSLVAALVIVRPPYLGDPGPGYIVPEPTLLQYGLAAVCVIVPLVAVLVLLLRPKRPWLTIAIMLATGFGLFDVAAGVIGVILTILVIQAEVRGTFPNFW